MQFIWNDEYCKWIGKDKPSICTNSCCCDTQYNQNDYVIVRKLFVVYKGQLPLNQNFVNNVFAEYGAVESVELIIKPSVNTISKDPFEAYVTYVNNLGASSAYQSLISRSQNDFIVQPANTWHQPTQPIPNQPTQPINTSTNEPCFQDLIEDCLLNIFKFCELQSLVQLSETCTRFNDIVHRSVFPQIKEIFVVKNRMGYATNFNLQTSWQTVQYYGTLAMVREILRRIGSHIEELYVEWNDETTECHMKRFFQIINRYVGSNIRILALRSNSSDAVLVTLMREIRSVLVLLDTLRIDVRPDSKITLQTFCPNLRKLVLRGDVQFDNITVWQSLQRLSILKDYRTLVIPSTIRFEINFNMLLRFLQLNPQIKKLKYENVSYSNRLLQAVCIRLPNIERLTIGIDQGDISGLKRLANQNKYLKQLCLTNIDQNYIVDVITSLEEFKNLVELKLIFAYIQYATVDAHAFLQIAQKLHQLEIFMIGCCSLNEAMISDFIRFAKNLKEFHLHWCVESISESLIDKIVETKKNHHPPSTQPLNLFVDEIDESMGMILQISEIRRYLIVKYKCEHSKF